VVHPLKQLIRISIRIFIYTYDRTYDKMVDKQKLTLSVDKTAVTKAKEMGLNLSEITEQILIGYTYENEKLDDEILKQQYLELFKSMLPIMKKHNYRLKIGETSFLVDNLVAKMETFLQPTGFIWNSWTDEETLDLSGYNLTDLYSPKQITSHFLEELSNIVNRGKILSRELEMAKRIVGVISEMMLE